MWPTPTLWPHVQVHVSYFSGIPQKIPLQRALSQVVNHYFLVFRVQRCGWNPLIYFKVVLRLDLFGSCLSVYCIVFSCLQYFLVVRIYSYFIVCSINFYTMVILSWIIRRLDKTVDYALQPVQDQLSTQIYKLSN